MGALIVVVCPFESSGGRDRGAWRRGRRKAMKEREGEKERESV